MKVSKFKNIVPYLFLFSLVVGLTSCEGGKTQEESDDKQTTFVKPTGPVVTPPTQTDYNLPIQTRLEYAIASARYIVNKHADTTIAREKEIYQLWNMDYGFYNKNNVDPATGKIDITSRIAILLRDTKTYTSSVYVDEQQVLSTQKAVINVVIEDVKEISHDGLVEILIHEMVHVGQAGEGMSSDDKELEAYKIGSKLLVKYYNIGHLTVDNCFSSFEEYQSVVNGVAQQYGLVYDQAVPLVVTNCTEQVVKFTQDFKNKN